MKALLKNLLYKNKVPTMKLFRKHMHVSYQSLRVKYSWHRLLMLICSKQKHWDVEFSNEAFPNWFLFGCVPVTVGKGFHREFGTVGCRSECRKQPSLEG